MNKPAVGSEVRRAGIAAMLGAALGLLSAIFSRRETIAQTPARDRGGRAWRGKSAT